MSSVVFWKSQQRHQLIAAALCVVCHMYSSQLLQRLKMCSGFGYSRSYLLAIIYNDYSHRGRSSPDCRTLGSSTKKECGGNSEDWRVVMPSHGVSKPAWLCIAVCRSQAYQIQIQVQNQFVTCLSVQAKNRNRRHETRLLLSIHLICLQCDVRCDAARRAGLSATADPC